MTRSWFALALLAAACGKGKNEGEVAPGSAMTGSDSRGSSAPATPVALPVIAGHGAEASTHPARVSVSTSSLIVDGKPVAGVAAVVDGLSAPSSAPRFVLALDKSLQVQVLLDLVTTLKTQGLTSYGLLAQKTGGETVMLPFDLAAKPRSEGADLHKQLDEIKKAGAEVKVGGSMGGRAAPSGGSADDGPPSTVVVEVRDVSLTPESSLGADVAKAKLSSTYLSGLRRCVKSFAEKDATTASSFTMTFAINESGTGVDAKAMGVTNDAASCIAQQAAAWRFPVPKDADRKGIKVSATVTFDISVDETAVRENAANASMLPGETVTAPDAATLPIAITKDEITVEKARIALASPDAAAQLSTQLEAILKGQKLAVRVSVEPSTSMQRLAELLGAIRATPAGAPLASSVVLAID